MPGSQTPGGGYPGEYYASWQASVLTVDPGAVPITGSAVVLTVAAGVSASAGAIPIAGDAATFTVKRKPRRIGVGGRRRYRRPQHVALPVDAGQLPIAGTRAVFRVDRWLVSAVGSPLVHGGAADLPYAARLAVDAGAVPVMGMSAHLAVHSAPPPTRRARALSDEELLILLLAAA